MALPIPPLELLMRFGIDIIAVLLLIFGMYYRRRYDKEFATTAVMFNVATFSVLIILSSVEFGVAAGFGLFAILALFRLRSEQFDKVEISYFFASIAIALVCSVTGTMLGLVATVVVFLLLSAFILDHPRFLQAVSGVKIVLDEIDHRALTDEPAMRTDLGKRLGVEVIYYEIKAFDYVNETALINVFFRNK
ncbi:MULTISPECIES: DUF4956 domain-containing protein [Labrys]|uniref:DUF4956 domain-containing protein n=1 Tax=Labrys neptuniae TaxID=376174 RepID=A0ABV3PVP9_9HYPH